MTQRTVHATFEIDLTPGDAVLDGTHRMDFTKTWSGEIEGTSRGAMLSAGDPGRGDAGYVALEVLDASIDGRRGTLVLQQSGTMTGGDAELSYRIVPGSGTGELAGITGTVDLEVTDGRHEVTLTYELPA